ncbi:hypothetical protein Acr_00g0024130 [Actinidia rufa]|uniref:Uncharacterized protein n=1 Tax=Actinidia rufa TaxID=165716 RepID=A0A7J0DEU7_9ERIC|nr:hypothetical protein Acr_00g0024130 [Actinidia rufa]
MLNKRRNWVLLVVEPKVPAGLISISSSDSEHLDALTYAPPQLTGEVEIAHSFRECNDTDVSLEPPESCDILGPHEVVVNRVEEDKEKVGNFEYELNKAKLALVATDQLKADLAALDMPDDNPAWTKAAPATKLPKSPEPYSLVILLGFNGEEYMNQSAEEDDE